MGAKLLDWTVNVLSLMLLVFVGFGDVITAIKLKPQSLLARREEIRGVD